MQEKRHHHILKNGAALISRNRDWNSEISIAVLRLVNLPTDIPPKAEPGAIRNHELRYNFLTNVQHGTDTFPGAQAYRCFGPGALKSARPAVPFTAQMESRSGLTTLPGGGCGRARAF